MENQQLEQLNTVLMDKRPSFQESTAEALGKIGDKRAIEPLIAALAVLVFVTLSFVLVPFVANAQEIAWRHVKSGGSVNALAINTEGHIFAGGSTNILILRSTDNGDTWTLVNTGLPTSAYVVILTINSKGHIFAVTTSNGIFRSTDNGDSWTNVSATSRIEDLAINANDHIFVGVEFGGILRSINNGDSWTKVNTGLPSVTTSVTSLAISPNGHIFAAAGGVYRSIDNGDSWVPSGLTDQTVRRLAINTKGYIFAGTNTPAVFRSMDNGDSWMNVRNGLAGFFRVSSFAFTSDGHIFAGTTQVTLFNGGGIYRSSDNGENWKSASSSWPGENNVYSLAINSRGFVFAGTLLGVFRSVSPVTEVQEMTSEGLPSSFTLEQNYPNPFNPETKIRYQLPMHSRARLEIFNLRGELVKTLVDQDSPAGEHVASWTGRDDSGRAVSTGVYFYILHAGEFVQTRKMILMK